ncbi:MAG: universal stress protein [Balneolaceae bacterium]
MYSIKRLLVVMELNDHDDVVCDYVNRITDLFSIESILFLHVADNLDVPKELVEKYPGLIPPIDDSIKGAIQEKIKNYPRITSINDIDYQILDGVKLRSISAVVREHDIDLLVINRSDENDSESEVAFLQKVVRSVGCTITLVPPTLPDDINTLLVPIDFSKNSFMALEHALNLAKKRPNIEIHALHIYKIPSGYFKTGLSIEGFAEELLKAAKVRLHAFLSENKIDENSFKMHFKLQKNDSVPYMINRFSFSNQVDAVIMGSRGRNTLSSFVLGSITEALIDRDQYLPLIIVKNKGRSMKLWDALLEL